MHLTDSCCGRASVEKKKSPESARRDGSDFDSSDMGPHLAANNNHADAAYDPAGMADLHLHAHISSSSSNNNDFHGPEETPSASSKTTYVLLTAAHSAHVH